MKKLRRTVVESKPLGRGTFHYRLSCGHEQDRVGVVPRGYAEEVPALTAICYVCSKSAAQQGGES